MENVKNELLSMENTGLVVTEDMTHEQRVNLFNAVNNAEGLSDQVGKDLWLTAVSYTHLRAHETYSTISYAVFCL